MTLKRLGWCALALVIAAFVAAIGTSAEGYLRAPGLVTSFFDDHHQRVRPEDLSEQQLQILLAVEDPSFFEHSGIDLTTPGAGLTTITQALVKRLFFERFEPGLAKIPQTLLALGFDLRVEKATQLAMFLNLAYMGTVDGRAVLGFEDAARTFYGKSTHQLTRVEFTSLVALLIGPTSFSPIDHPEENLERVARIERLLAGRCRPNGNRDVYYEACKRPLG